MSDTTCILSYPNEVEARKRSPAPPSIESEEVEYAACLFISGPPDFIAKKNWGRKGIVPVSTTSYRSICYGFWCNHVRSERQSMPTPLFSQKEFLDWWARYKMWMAGND